MDVAAAEDEMSAKFDGVQLIRGQRRILDRFDLSLPAKSRVALVGPSGVGKSTVLDALLGFVPTKGGTIDLFGERVTGPVPRAALARIGYVAQDGGLFPHLRARDNLVLAARDQGRSDAECDARVRELCDLVRLGDSHLLRYPSELSGGERQRIALARALFAKPELLLLDEPLGAVDPVARRALQDELVALFDELGVTVLIVTHDLPEAAFLCDRIALLDHGRVVQEGTFDDLRDRPASPRVEAFVGAFRGLP